MTNPRTKIRFEQHRRKHIAQENRNGQKLRLIFNLVEFAEQVRQIYGHGDLEAEER